ncbi:hypothetical protein [Acanthamoeba castellanii mimivirus]|uniref:Uncharacterized protein L729 n=7 Tax=Mimivirus TaxID=315393 RepID=YL729_MIMIV|nr:hypothetical protein MIMI_gp0788 [Acanthamoeba polyphaga mimivirus]Q5UNY3.1 RecName: Full=Uncharacterized protein L729 [Acanthamoeba polyphaga mimivirus]AEQ60940.1 hypothetical protein [Acanthamoeba castellanii mamavirus]ALR84352.1 hypothetical protein [Niemeyer virus]AMZ03174.1 hypothetical protein [Mimivirus Bombay]EJN41139.1 hypothetical protein lvs_L636 [Acanthamoeba polyphaga lentillevirus]BAV61863.1 hypothetical protein [Acanthamoeba castellanii mimivirus]
MSEDKNYIIDPLTALCKVALLHFMPDKTKLAINHHVLYIQGYSYYQWLERMKNGDSRVDISNLNMPIIKAVKWYIIDSEDKAELDSETCNNILIITKYTIKGLIKLQQTYCTDNAIKIILQYLINLLRDAIDNNWNDDNCVKIDNHHNILSDKIKKNFESQTISAISKILTDAERMSGSQEDVNALIDCAHKLLINRDTVFVRMMKEVNTHL